MSSTFLTIPQIWLETIRSAQRIVVLTGAGISAESGIPTFRDLGTGLWQHVDPEQVASLRGFRENPSLVWRWHAELEQKIAQTQPNPAHYALAALEQYVPQLDILTQNIDGLHQRAGSSRVIELHGSLAHVKCSHDGLPVESWDAQEEPPRCPRCGAYLRHDVVWFGEMLASDRLAYAYTAIEQCDLFFAIGTSGQVEPAASFPIRAYEHGAKIVIINLDVETNVSLQIAKFHAPAGQLLPALFRAAWPDFPTL
jgi:NAD-dependent deacetylase